ncbi:MAG: murein biosynthesis integral membrane protein MurJ [Planctomycetota bacterium]|nr:murein biosynthesis integral membrane protein MurJ [Planctomycetota bacterium]MDA1248010.1 murein biosynthesis integral membrane protein MurJ [Planctomycetota bacterium]
MSGADSLAPENGDPSTAGAGTSRGTMIGRVRSVGILTLVSRILGLVRDGVMATQFGNGVIRDAFTVAFRIPNLARQLFGEGALSTAFLPVFIRDLEKHGKESAFRTATAVLIAVSVFLFWALLIAEGIVLAIWHFADLNHESRLLLGLTATLLPYLLLVCVLAQSCAIMHGLGNFKLPAMFPVLLNALWISAAIVVWNSVDDLVSQIYLISVSVVGIGVLQLALSFPTLKRLGFEFQSSWRDNRDRVREIRRVMLPVVLGLSITQLNTLLDSLIAWLLTAPADPTQSGWLSSYPLTEGTASALYLGQRLFQFPLGVFGVALGTVIFPLLAQHSERNDMAGFRDDFLHGLRLVIGIGLPASAGLILIASPLTDALFRHGAFDLDDAHQTSAMIVMYALGVWASCGLLIINRAFYALGDRRTPLRAGVLSVVVNLAASLTLVWSLRGQGLALATSISAAFQCGLATWLLSRRLESVDWRSLIGVTWRAVVCTVVMSIVVLALSDWLSGFNYASEAARRATLLASPVVAGMFVYLATARLVGLGEPFELIHRQDN